MTVVLMAMSFFGTRIFYHPLHVGLWLLIAIKSIAVLFTSKGFFAKVMHLAFGLLILALAGEINFNKIEYITLAPGESKTSNIDDKYVITLNEFSLPSEDVNNFVSEFTIESSDGEKFTGVASVNHPYSFDGYLLYQYAYEENELLKSTLMLRTTRFTNTLFVISLIFAILLALLPIMKRRRSSQ
jgi:cytochrome c biogenesis protein ResB